MLPFLNPSVQDKQNGFFVLECNEDLEDLLNVVMLGYVLNLGRHLCLFHGHDLYLRKAS